MLSGIEGNLNNIKLVVIDIDGTLLVRADEISKENISAINELKRLKIAVSLCSGRATPAARSVLNQLNLEGYHIFFDGALVTNPEKQEHIYIKTVDRSLFEKAIDFAHQTGIIMDLFSATKCYMDQESWVTRIRREYFKVEPIITDFSCLPDSEVFIKGTLVVRTPEEKAGVEQFRQQFSKEFHLSLTKTPAYPDIDFVNVIAPGVSKWTALEALMTHLKITTDQVMAIGDGPNDVQIISAVRWGVAMGNATPEVKAAARYVTGDVDHDGLAEAINRFVLE
jgi:5-amino-6-(5-phospho-D-ribitylamino)uracil phosphatase